MMWRQVLLSVPLLACMLIATTGLIQPSLYTCNVVKRERIKCGFTTGDACEEAGCCFDYSARRGRQCFHPNNQCELGVRMCDRGAKCIDGDNAQYFCKCPFDPIYNYTNCRTRQGKCDVAPEGRTGCGRSMRTRDPATVCRNRGCCFDNSIRRSIWCFHPSSEIYWPPIYRGLDDNENQGVPLTNSNITIGVVSVVFVLIFLVGIALLLDSHRRMLKKLDDRQELTYAVVDTKHTETVDVAEHTDSFVDSIETTGATSF